MNTYEKKYKKLVSKIEKAYLYAQTDSTKAVLEEIRPELKESEGERIREQIISFIEEYGNPAHCEWQKEWIAWLEKQNEKEPANKIEPKFQNGQWIVWQNKCYKVNDNGCGYELIDTNGLSTSLEYETVDENAHLWTIEDAKDGDALVYGDNPADHHLRIIMLFKSMRTFNSAFNHFHIFDDEFRINDWCDCGKTAHPATKEQRDQLFKKMREAGFEWDAEKLELRKIVNPSEPELVGMKELGKVWDEKQDPILQRLDRIYALLLHKMNEKIIINNPFPRLTETPYKLGEIWCDSASASTEKKNEP